MIKHSLAILVIGAAGAAQATLPPCAYDEMMAAAATVVQIETPVIGSPDNAGSCEMTGIVARVLRGDASPGDAVTVAVPCAWDGTVGGTIWSDPAAVAASPAIELHLDDTGALAGYGMGILLLPALTDTIVWVPFVTGGCD